MKIKASAAAQKYAFYHGEAFPPSMQNALNLIFNADLEEVRAAAIYKTGNLLQAKYHKPQKKIMAGALLQVLSDNDLDNNAYKQTVKALNKYVDGHYITPADKKDFFTQVDISLRYSDDVRRQNVAGFVIQRLTHSNDDLGSRFKMADGLVTLFADKNTDLRHHVVTRAARHMADGKDNGQPLWMLEMIDDHANKIDAGTGNDYAPIAHLKRLAEGTKIFVNVSGMRELVTQFQGDALHVSQPMGEANEHAVLILPRGDADQAVGIIKNEAHEMTSQDGLPFRIVNTYRNAEQTASKQHYYDYTSFFNISEKTDKVFNPVKHSIPL